MEIYLRKCAPIESKLADSLLCVVRYVELCRVHAQASKRRISQKVKSFFGITFIMVSYNIFGKPIPKIFLYHVSVCHVNVF